jgi:hypothetical protein
LRVFADGIARPAFNHEGKKMSNEINGVKRAENFNDLTDFAAACPRERIQRYDLVRAVNLTGSELTLAESKILAVLCHFTNTSQLRLGMPFAWCSTGYLAQVLGTDRRQVQRVTAKLEEKWFLIRHYDEDGHRAKQAGFDLRPLARRLEAIDTRIADIESERRKRREVKTLYRKQPSEDEATKPRGGDIHTATYETETEKRSRYVAAAVKDSRVARHASSIVPPPATDAEALHRLRMISSVLDSAARHIIGRSLQPTQDQTFALAEHMRRHLGVGRNAFAHAHHATTPMEILAVLTFASSPPSLQASPIRNPAAWCAQVLRSDLDAPALWSRIHAITAALDRPQKAAHR